jgi:lipopolysaccharide export system protein LptA
VLKRVVVSLVALVVLLTCYAGYVSMFGHFSQLKPLPPDREPPALSSDADWTLSTPTANHAKEVARKVWGAESWQASDDVVTLYWLQSGVIVYIQDYEKESPDTWRLIPFALVYTEPAKAAKTPSQMVTLEGQEATLVFDRPVDLIRMSGARPIGGKISGNVQIQADRGTESPVDDFVAYADDLRFEEAENRVWTDSPVRMVSADAVMTGTSGEMHLKFSDSAGPGRDSPRFQGVSDLVLFRDVQVNMLASTASGTASHATRSAAVPHPKHEKSPKTEPKTPVQITCRGPFRYDLEKSEAHFSQHVVMVRQTGESEYDRLFSDELAVLFERAAVSGADSADIGSDQESDKLQFQFREARATGRAVRVLSDAQSIEAIGQEVVYDAVTGHTVLRGDPEVVATREGNVLHGREVKFAAAEPGRQFAEVSGEGSLESRDANGELRLIARWSQHARVEPQNDQNKQQLLTLQGAAEVEQPGRGSFYADRLRVWLVPNTGDALPSGSDHDSDTSKWAPSRVEGVGQVVARSEQFVLEAANRLDMVFIDVPASAIADASDTVSDSAAAVRASKPGAGSRDKRNSSPERSRPVDSATPNIRNAQPRSHLAADLVKIKVLRMGDRSEVSEVETEGQVKFEQSAAKDHGDSVLVHGDALSLKRVEDKSFLQVSGRPAHVELNSMKLDGDRVNIDQPTNTAWVDGKGLMILVSDSSFEGKKLDAPSELTIAWGTRMFFNGLVAEFGGGVEARQGTSKLRCQSLVAKLTEPMDLAAPNKQESGAAKIKELDCLDSVVLDNAEFQNDRLEKHEHLETGRLTFSNETGQMTAQGPGVVRTYTRGQSDLGSPQLGAAAGRSAKTARQDDDQLLLTEVLFSDRLDADRPNQLARFYGHVEVLRSPVASENELVDPDNLPPKSMRISCGKLEMGSKRGPDDHPYNIMVASDNVYVEADVFSGRGDRVSYNQLLERITFESRPDSYATFYRQLQRGQPPDFWRARKILYDIRTADPKVEGAIVFDLQEREADRRDTQKKDSTKRR